MLAPEIERMAATILAKDGRPRFVWTDTQPDPITYARVLMKTIAERMRWRAQYAAAKDRATNQQDGPGDNCSTTGPAP